LKIKRIIVDEMPESCGKCWLMRYRNNDIPICCGIPDEHNEIVGNPLDMNYRRSDCPLVEEYPEGMKLEDLDLTVRAYNCLRLHGVRTVEELQKMSDEELHSVRNFNQKCIDEVREKLGGI
jgi:DNA-directed RNA polymerase alpha subunit